jgi:hypothetical protein
MSALRIYKYEHGAYHSVGTFTAVQMDKTLMTEELAEALGTGAHEVFAVWEGPKSYGKRFRVTVGATTVTEL